MREDELLETLQRSIESLFRSVWSATIGDSIRSPQRMQLVPNDLAPISASISIHGERSAEVTLTCSWDTARQFAAAMFRKDVSLLEEEEVRATLREFVNILGGNLKGAFPGRNRLSLPRIEGPPAPLPDPAGACRARLDFRGWPFELAVRELA